MTDPARSASPAQRARLRLRSRLRLRARTGPARRLALAVLAAAVLAFCAACSGTAAAGSNAASPSTGTAASATPGSSGTTVTVPLRVVSTGKATLEVVPVSIDGHGPYKFLLDTGSSVSSISKHLARTLGLRQTGSTQKVHGVVSAKKIPLVRVSNWKLGHARLAPETIGAISMSSSTAGSKAGIAGLLGSDELSRFGWIRIDFQHRQLILGRTAATASP